MSIYFTNYTWTALKDNIVVSTSSVEEVPSNKQPLLNLTCNGVLLPTTSRYELLLSFPGGQGPSKDALSGCYGTFCIGKRVLNAVKILKTAYDKEKRELLIVFDLKSTTHSCSITRPTRFSFAVQLNDCPLDCGSSCTGNCGCLYLFGQPIVCSTG